MNQQQEEDIALRAIMVQVSEVMQIKNKKKLRKFADCCLAYYARGFEAGLKTGQHVEQKPVKSPLILPGGAS